MTRSLRKHFHLDFKSDCLCGNRFGELNILMNKNLQIKFPLIQLNSRVIEINVKILLIHLKCILMIQNGIKRIYDSNSGYGTGHDFVLKTRSVTVSRMNCRLYEFYINVSRLANFLSCRFQTIL